MSSLQAAADKAIEKISYKYNLALETEEETRDMWDSIRKFMIDEFSAVVSDDSHTTDKTSKSKVKKSKKPNYYAHFHGACSVKKQRDPGPLGHDIQFTYHPDQVDLIPKDKKGLDSIVSCIETINSKPELLEEFTNFKCSSLVEVSTFLDNVDEFKNLDLMRRTAMIWWLFLTEESRENFKSWYKTVNNDTPSVSTDASEAVVTQPKARLSLKPHKVTSAVVSEK